MFFKKIHYLCGVTSQAHGVELLEEGHFMYERCY